MKRGAIEYNYNCSFQKSPFDVRNYASVLATPIGMDCVIISESCCYNGTILQEIIGKLPFNGHLPLIPV